MIRIVPVGLAEADEWTRQRRLLWPDEVTGSADEVNAMLADFEIKTAFLALGQKRRAVGFAEASIRRDYVNGCDTSPVLFLEGIYVEADLRRQGIGRSLCEAIARWGAAKGCSEFASDTAIDNIGSRRFHAALGFIETEEVVFFRRHIKAGTEA